jgi:phosphoglycolate phosphatase-like HAD superfamily hydrolase
VILASSAQKDELERYVKLLGAGERIAGATSSADAERTKPHPELVETALDKYGSGGPALMIGDSTWDVKAAKAAGVPTLALLTGGFAEAELREAGAVEVKRSLAKLREEGVDAVLTLAGTDSP